MAVKTLSIVMPDVTATTMAKKWSIWYEPPKGWDLAVGAWVTGEDRKPLVFSTEREAKKDLKQWAIHPQCYEVRPHGRT